MRIFELKDEYSKPIAIALGFFDCIHVGHKKLINTAISHANDNINSALESALFTFCNDPNLVFGKDRQIYTFDDRVKVLKQLGIDNIISANFDNDFMNLSPIEFLQTLFDHFNIKVVVVGSDYTFGNAAKGNVQQLTDYCNNIGVRVEVVPFETINGKKLGTTSLKSLVINGEVDTLNTLIATPYFIEGEVVAQRKVGKSLGFPTANIYYPNDRLQLKEGIYATITTVDGVRYHSMTNVGDKPTFMDNSKSIETHVFDFDQDIYGKIIQVEFIKRTRDICKFTSLDALKTQLFNDETQIKNILENIR